MKRRPWTHGDKVRLLYTVGMSAALLMAIHSYVLAFIILGGTLYFALRALGDRNG